METATKILASATGLVSTVFIFLFNSQNKKIDAQDIKINDLDDKKTDSDLCKVLHKSLDDTTTEIKTDVAGIKKDQTALLISNAKILTSLKDIKSSIDKNGA